jgi:hypothetical protein
MSNMSKAKPFAHADDLHRAPRSALDGLDATIIECLGQRSMRQAGKLGKGRPQCLGPVERLARADEVIE